MASQNLPSRTDAPQPECDNCDSQGCVCENHNHVPQDDGDQGCCCGAGQPCPVCNVPADGEAPRMPAGSRLIWSRKDTAH